MLSEKKRIEEEKNLIKAVKAGDLKGVKKSMEACVKGLELHQVLNAFNVFSLAAKEEQLEILKFLFVEYFMSTYFETALSVAAENGCLKSIKLLIALGATKLNDALTATLVNRQLEAAKLLVQLGAEFSYNAFYIAIKNYSIELAKFIIETSYPDWSSSNSALCWVLENSVPEKKHIEIFDLCMSLRNIDFNDALCIASKCNCLKAIKALEKLGAKKLNEALCEAVIYEKLEAIKLLIDLGANNISQALRISSYACACIPSPVHSFLAKLERIDKLNNIAKDEEYATQ